MSCHCIIYAIDRQQTHNHFSCRTRTSHTNLAILTSTLIASQKHIVRVRKQYWHGIIYRHLLCVFRHANYLDCPLQLFNHRWKKHFTATLQPSIDAHQALRMSILSDITDVVNNSDIPSDESGWIPHVLSNPRIWLSSRLLLLQHTEWCDRHYFPSRKR